MARFARIACSCPTEQTRKGKSNFLGSVQLDVPHTTHKHCKTCNTTWELTVDDSGTVRRRRVASEIIYTDSVVIIEVA